MGISKLKSGNPVAAKRGQKNSRKKNGKAADPVAQAEAERLVAEGLPEKVAWADPDEHQFFVPARARWQAIQETATNIGGALNEACSALEEANGSLEGVLAGIDFNDERRLGNAKNRDAVLSRLVQHFGKLSLRNDHLSEPDMLGRAYEYLIEKFADDAGKKGGEFYTPRKVVQLIVEILAPKEGMRICDPTCGSGGMLIECAQYVQRSAGNARNLTLHGQEKNELAHRPGPHASSRLRHRPRARPPAPQGPHQGLLGPPGQALGSRLSW